MVEWKVSLPPSAPPPPHVANVILGSLSNDDGDGNENGIKAIGLDWLNSRSTPGEYSSKSLKHSIVKGIYFLVFKQSI